jgi:hypothetical protein
MCTFEERAERESYTLTIYGHFQASPINHYGMVVNGEQDVLRTKITTKLDDVRRQEIHRYRYKSLYSTSTIEGESFAPSRLYVRLPDSGSVMTGIRFKLGQCIMFRIDG